MCASESLWAIFLSKGARTKEEGGRGKGEGEKIKQRGKECEHATRKPEGFSSKRER